MAATFSAAQIERKTVFGDRRIVFATVTASGTNTSGGDAFDAGAVLGLGRVDVLVFESAATNGTAAIVPTYDATNKKIKFFGGAASGVVLAELTAGTTVTSYAVRVMAVGV